MINKDIKYNLSTDYEKLFKLLKEGITLVGFIALEVNNVISDEYSKLITLSYNKEFKSFDIGFVFFEVDFNKISFKQLCEQYHIRYIDLN